jgi:CxxC motif-containing protein
MPKTTLSSKVSEQTKQRVENYAEEKGISRSEAVDRLVRKSLKIENGEVEIVPVSTDGGTKVEKQLDRIEDNLQDSQKRSVAESPMNKYPYTVPTLVLVFFIFLRVFGFV